MTTRPIAEGVWTEEASPRLIGGRDRRSGRIVFPLPAGGAAETFDPYPLARRGRIWSWTVQRFAPKAPPYVGPQPFTPFAMAYVELPGEVIVETRLTGFAFEALACGLLAQLVIIPFCTAADKTMLTTYAFAPIEGDRL